MRERRGDVLEILVDVEVIGLDVGHDRDVGRQAQEGSVVLVRLDHKQLVAFVAQIPLPLGDATASEPGRLESSRCENGSSHHRRRSLAVRTGYANQLATRYCLAEGLC